MLFYFTATGNSLYAAKQLDDNRVSIAQAIHKKERKYTADKIGIVCPVFGHEVPGLVREFLSEAEFKTDYFYLVLTYGSRHGGAAELAQRMLEEMGIHPSYINVVWMADNFLPGFDMDEEKRMDKKVDTQLGRIREDIENRVQFIPPVTDSDRQTHWAYLARAVAEGLVTQEELFITTKVWVQDAKSEDTAYEAVRTSLSKLNMPYVNLVLLHQPMGDYFAAYRGVEKAYRDGLTKAIGVANFYPAILTNLCENVDVIPAVNQVELHPFFVQEGAVENMKAYGVVPQAWGPLAEGKHGPLPSPMRKWRGLPPRTWGAARL